MISLLVEIPESLYRVIQEHLAQNPALDQDALIAEALMQYLPQAR